MCCLFFKIRELLSMDTIRWCMYMFQVVHGAVTSVIHYRNAIYVSDFWLYEQLDTSQFMSRPRILKTLDVYFLLSGFDSFASSKIGASLSFRYSLIGCCNIVSGLLYLSLPRWLSWMRRPTGDQEVAGSIPAEVGNILSWRLIMKYFLRSFSPFRWFKKGSCQFLAKECAQYWLTA